MDRLLVAKAIGRSPSSSEFRLLLSSSLKYGMTTGTEKASRIELTALGRKAMYPRSEKEGYEALREAAQQPELFAAIYAHFDQAQLPKGDFFHNTLQREFGIAIEHCNQVAELVRANGRLIGIFEKIGNSEYVMLGREPPAGESRGEVEAIDDSGSLAGTAPAHSSAFGALSDTPAVSPGTASEGGPSVLRVFISHSRNVEIVEQIKTMLELQDMDYEIAVESETTAIPVPDKVLESMRSCNAAVICVTADGEGDENASSGVNQNVLIEIGAAFVLYDRRVVLVWDTRLDVPSNLQGLYRCEIEDNDLSWAKGMKLMAALKTFKE